MNNLFVFSNVPLYDDSQESLVLGNIEKQIIPLIKYRKNYNIKILASTLWEFHGVDSLSITNKFFEDFSNIHDIPYYLLYNSSVDQVTTPWNKKNTINYLFFLNKVIHSIRYFGQKLNQRWNHDKFRFLFLTGKLHKSNRILPLIKFSENNLLNYHDCIWSLHYRPHLIEEIHKIIPQYTQKEIKKFCNLYQSSPDKTHLLDLNQTTHYDGVPFNHQIYKDTSFSVISESECFGNDIWITEKTWRAILNKHPFMILGQRRTLKYLEKIGFKTFEKYLPYKYDEVDLFDNRMEIVIKNLTWLKNNWNTLDFKSIRLDIESNYLLALRKSNTDLINFHNSVGFQKGDSKVHSGLYLEARDKVHTVNISRDHLCYYNWANYSNDYFWRKL